MATFFLDVSQSWYLSLQILVFVFSFYGLISKKERWLHWSEFGHRRKKKSFPGFYSLDFTQICHLFAVDTWNSVQLPCAINEVVLASALQPWEDEGWSDQISRVDEGCVLRTHATAVLLSFIFYCYKLIFLYIFKSKLILFVSFNCIIDTF
jgi:hypothetical protein